MALGQADALQRAREAEPMHEPEQERHERREASGQRVTFAQGLAGDQHDRQRDAGLDGRGAQRDPAHRRERKRHAVRQGESADRADELSPEADEKEQACHEEQMVDAAQDVLDAEHGVRARDFAHPAAIVR